jgi:tetratricopeptide (TPR) repeat protein
MNAIGRVVLLSCFSALLAACAAPFAPSGRSPPAVDVPEPGARSTAPAVARPAPAPASAPPAASTYPAAPPRYPTAGGYPGNQSAIPSGVYSERAPQYPLPLPGAAAQENGVAIPLPGSAATEDSLGFEPVTPPAAAASGPGYLPPARSDNSAVNTLLAQAAGERSSGNVDGAIAAAERALRIAPADPAVYCELATLRLQRGDLAMAEQLARKGLSYQPDPELRQRLDEIIERARRGWSG